MAMHNGWRRISGENNWSGLLTPLDIELRRSIIHYGEMAQSTYDGFNDEKSSRNFGACRFRRRNFFGETGLGLASGKYKITKYIYVTSKPILQYFSKNQATKKSSGKSSLMGYVAVATYEGKNELGRREIVISWRGTMLDSELYEDFRLALQAAPTIFGENSPAKVHRGFRRVYSSNISNSDPRFPNTCAREQVVKEVRKLIEKHKREEVSITVTGNSLGAAIATLNAADIVSNKYNAPNDDPNNTCLVTSIVFASPRVGNMTFSNLVSTAPNLHVLRIRNSGDLVTRLPPKPLYIHACKKLRIKTDNSPYLKRSLNPAKKHNLEVYLHGVAGVMNGGKRFNLKLKRDIKLVNKNGTFWLIKSRRILVPLHGGAKKTKAWFSREMCHTNYWMRLTCLRMRAECAGQYVFLIYPVFSKLCLQLKSCVLVSYFLLQLRHC